MAKTQRAQPTVAAKQVIDGRRSYAVVQDEALSFLQRLPSSCVDAVIADPPYSSGGMFRGDRARTTSRKYVNSQCSDRYREFEGDNRDQRSFLAWCTLWLSECLRISKPGAVACIFVDWRQLPTMTDALQAAGWVWRGIVPWDKTESCRPRKGAFRSQCEYVVWGSNGSLPMRDDIGALPGLVRAASRAKKWHMAAKPVEIMQTLCRVCPADGVILDPFAGSGSTGCGALAIGRRFLGVELSSDFCQIATDRLDEAQRACRRNAEQAVIPA